MNDITKQENDRYKVSVVIASGAGGKYLKRCLSSLHEQFKNDDLEVIVVDRCGDAFDSSVLQEFPYISLIQPKLDHRLSVPELRGIGALQASGDIVAIIEEHCIAEPDWIQTIRSWFQDDYAAIGGPILDNRYTRLIDWAVYFSEYHNYLPPWHRGERTMLNGANIAYKRNTLVAHADLFTEGYWEVVLHPRLIEEGKFYSIPEMTVRHTGPFHFGYYVNQRYLLSRVWGGTQRDQVSSGKRVFYLIIGPLVPFLLSFRIGLRAWRSRQYFLKYIATLPLLIPITIAYAWGEWLGYLLGKGDALERVE